MRRVPISQWPWQRIAEWSVLGLIVFSILWKGGKGLEATWLLVPAAWVCTVVWWSKLETKNSQQKTLPPFLWLSVILFILWTALSYRYSLTQNYGLDEVLRDGSLGLLFLWIARNSYCSERVLRALANTALLACIVGVLIYIFQPVNRFVGTFFDYRFHTDYWPNAWAEFLLLAWPIVHWQTQYSGLKNRISHMILGVVFGCLLLSYSRGALLAFSAQLLLWCLIMMYRENGVQKPEEEMIWWRWEEWKPVVKNAAVIGCIAFGTFFSVNGARSYFHPVQDIGEKALFTAAEGTSSISERAQFWMQSWDLAWQRPLLGWGPYSFRFVQPRLQTEVLATSDHPHNIFLKLAMERGWVAAILFGLIVGYVLFFALRRVVSNKWSVVSPSLPADHYPLITISLVGVLAHNLIDYNLQFVGITLPFWLLLGILVSHEQKSDASRLPPPASRLVRTVEISIASLLFLIAIFEGRFLLLSSLGRHAEARGNAESALWWYNSANEELYSRDLHLSRSGLLISREDFTRAEDALGAYAARNAQDARVWKLQGDLNIKKRDADGAIAFYEKALEFGRWNDLGILRGLLEAVKEKGDRSLIDARKVDTDDTLLKFAAAIEENVHFIALSRNVEEFLMLSQMLSKIYPEEAPRYETLGARVDRHAQEERSRLAARRPGVLW